MIATNELELTPDLEWSELPAEAAARIDPTLRLIVSLFAARDLGQLARRTGIAPTSENLVKDQRLPLFLEFDISRQPLSALYPAFKSYASQHQIDIRIAPAYLREADENRAIRHVTAQLALDTAELSPETARSYALTVKSKLALLINAPGLRRVSVPMPMQPALQDSLRDIELPADRVFRGRTVNGNGVIVGIIDDGCALAHRNFLDPSSMQSRIQYLWDPARQVAQGGWSKPVDEYGNQDFDGLELTNGAIGTALGRPGTVKGETLNEDGVHAYLNYPIDDLTSHGTHVMDIAAGNGASLLGTEGVACNADIIFVQLPRSAVETGGALLENHILDGVAYIFARARVLGLARGLPGPVAAVVNISYGGYSGPHDGTCPLPSGIDQWIDQRANRAVVVSAGNGFEADCHATQEIQPSAASTPLRWILRPFDPTANVLQIWYDGTAQLALKLTPPNATVSLPAVALGQVVKIQRPSDQAVIGWIQHTATNTGRNLNCIEITLRPTFEDDPVALANAATAPAPSGQWTVMLENVGANRVRFHAWIERDDGGRPGRSRRQQSHFAPGDADPSSTLAGLATGVHAVCVGAHNTATSEVCRYSAAGPTSDGRTDKPDVCAPAEEDAAGRGVLCASSRQSQPSRMNGTSAAAPHVAGLAALMFQYNRDIGGPPLTANVVRAKIVAGARAAQLLAPPPPRDLRGSRHNLVDGDRPLGKKQQSVFSSVSGAGKIDFNQTLRLLD